MGQPGVDVAFRATSVIGEGPFWWDGRLIWVDLPVGILHQTDLATGRDESIDFGGVLGAAVPRVGGGYLAITDNGFAYIDEGTLVPADDVVSAAHLRMNDGKCDRAGRLWAGSTAYTHDAGLGRLHVWEPGAVSRVVDTGFALPNGIGWSPDDASLYLVDSIERRLYVYDFDLARGAVENRRVLAEFDGSGGLPDGLAVDADGAIWLAFFDGWCVRRLDDQGQTMATVRLPVSKPTSCAFGAGTDLYITSASVDLTAAERAEQPDAGSILRIDAGCAGGPVAFAR